VNLLAAERIKLLSTRSPWWCAVLAVALVTGVTGLAVLTSEADAGPVPPQLGAFVLQAGMVVVMVMAALSVTTEYRFGTIRTTFQAAPRRTAVLLAKTAVVAAAAAVVGLVAAFASWALVAVLRPAQALPLDTEEAWRAVAGAGPAFAVAAVLAVAVGTLVRHSAGAVAVLLVWALLAENLLAQLPGVGEHLAGWLPFANLTGFLAGGTPFGPWGSLGWVAAVAAALLTVALVVAGRRDA
jgi:ABC-2 type transport system permease protein